MYAQQFDNRLKLLTAALAGDPSTPLPGPRVPPGQGGGTTDADYASDVELAADIIRKQNDLQNRYQAKAIIGDTFRETDVVYNHDLVRLMTKWRGVSPQKGAQFERDFTARSRGVTTAAASPSRSAHVSTAPKPSFPVGFAAMAFLGLAGGVAFLIFRNRADTSFDSSQFRKPTTHGSASFGHNHPSTRDPSAASTGVFLGKVICQGQERLPLHLPEGARPVFTTSEHHTLIVARTRTGKGTRIIIPTLLRYAGSALVIDPKGENAAITARTRRDQLGHAVHIVNPWNVLAPHFEALDLEASTFNPLDVLHRADPNCVAVAQSLAATVCPTSPGDKDRFWQGSAASVLAAVFLWLTDRPDERKTLARAREIVTLSRKQFTEKFLVRMAASTAFGGAIRELVSPYLDLADETYSGILSNLNEATKFLSDPQIKAATEASSFDLTDLITCRTTIYLVIPPERIDTQRTWLRLVIAAAMHTFKQNASVGGAADRCQFLIDEFAALGRIEDLPRDIATISGYGVDFTLIVQSLDQLRDIYGEAAAGTILSNCAYKWFCNLNDLSTAKYLSECLGQTTVETVSRSTSLNADGKPSESTSHGETGRPLLSPDQILNLGREAAIALHPYGQPLYLRPVDYWNLTTAFHTLKDKYPALYWQPPLEPDRNPYHRAGDPA